RIAHTIGAIDRSRTRNVRPAAARGGSMKLIARIVVAACIGVLLGSSVRQARDANADPFNNLIEFHVTMSGTDHFATPDITVQLNIDCPGAVCPATSSAPLPDVMLQHFSLNIVPCRDHNPAPCTGNSVPIDALLGSATLQLQTNVLPANGPDNVS